jgi:hypothetical protein
LYAVNVTDRVDFRSIVDSFGPTKILFQLGQCLGSVGERCVDLVSITHRDNVLARGLNLDSVKLFHREFSGAFDLVDA